MARQAVAGLSTLGIARMLSLAELTVQDHLKSIFHRTGVRSRREPVARLTGDIGG